jgi:4-diphosphocytidyl-2-C-methyl-D-erythritol kinase
LRAYAKINLGLQILQKRVDGYHDIETVFHLIDLYDEIFFEPESCDITIDCSHPEVPLNQFNLCWRAADLIRRYCRQDRGVKIIFEKNIPVGAGLGGGSSNAALVLRELPKFWNIQVDEQALFTMALSLGSDVPYFLQPGTALASGRGEILEYFDLEMPYWIVLVYPNVRISTSWAYQNFRPHGDFKRENLKQILQDNIRNPQALAEKLRNDFETLVFATHTKIEEVKDMLYRSGADFALMSGSGSAVYGLYQTAQSAKDAAKSLGAKYQVFLSAAGFGTKATGA